MDTVGSSVRRMRPHATRFRPLVVVFVAACAGAAVDRAAGMPLTNWLAAAVIAMLAWFVAWRRSHFGVSLACLLLAVGVTAGAWHHLRWSIAWDNDLASFAREAQQPVCVEVVALEHPGRLPAAGFDPMRAIPAVDRSRLDVRAIRLRDGRRWQAVRGEATLLVDGHLLGVHAGDRLRVFGRLLRPSEPLNPGQFDRAGHARVRGQRHLLAAGFPDCVSVIGTDRGWSVAHAIGLLRAHGDALLWRHVSERSSPLATALLLGQREQLDAERTEAFFETGTIHLLAISGLHVGILAAGLFGVLRLGILPRNLVLLLIAALTLLYAVVTDAHAPVVRATVLVWIVCASLYLGRRPASFNTLAAAGLVVLAWNPAELFQAGAQLSFLAVATIAWFGTWWSTPDAPDPLRQLIARSRPWPVRGLRRVVRWWWRLSLVSAAIWLVALPLVMARFHLVSPVAVVLSPLLWLPVGLALSSGVGVLLFGWLLPPVADVCGAVCDVNLRLLETAVHGARAVPGSHFWVPGPSDWWLVVFYGSLAVWLAFPRWRPPVRWCVGLLAAWVTVGFGPSITRGIEQPRLQSSFVSIGHGAAVLLELPDGRTLLYDAGQLGSPGGAARTISDTIWSRGVTHLDAVVLSHADVDHYCAMPELLKRFSVGVVYVSPFMFEQGTAALVSLSDAIQAAGVPVESIHSGQRLNTGGGCRIEVLHPPRRGLFGSDNANSIVLAVQYAGRRILLPGDLESPGLEDVLAEGPWDCDVLLAPHHGSRLSNPQGLADWCRPEWVIISGGRGQDVTDVEESYRAAGSQVLHTAEVGAVTVLIKDGAIDVRPFRASNVWAVAPDIPE